MITGNIKDCAKYFSVNKNFKEAFIALKNIKYGENNTALTINFSEPYTTDTDADGNKRLFEAHKKYIDLHYILEGTEEMGYANTEALEPVTEYDGSKDVFFLKGEESRITLCAGDFAITFPEDAHIPFMTHGKSAKIKRAVVKIPAED